MNFLKQYLSQSITAASNNLRLNSQKIEVIALLKDFIMKSEDVEADIKGMKKVTELSTLAIRLNEVYNYLTHGQVDMFKISEKFKEHSQFLIRDISHMLDLVNPEIMQNSINKMREKNAPKIELEEIREINDEKNGEISVDLSKRPYVNDQFETSDKVKERIILDDEKEEDDFQNFEKSIIKPISEIDAALKRILSGTMDKEEIMALMNKLTVNGEIANKAGFDIIASMHRIAAKALYLIANKKLEAKKDIIESIRACLIVIAAVVKSKEVDIKVYLNKAEKFSELLRTIK